MLQACIRVAYSILRCKYTEDLEKKVRDRNNQAIRKAANCKKKN